MMLVAAGLVLVLVGGLAAALLASRGPIADRLFRWGVAVGCLLGVAPAVARLALAPAAFPELPAAWPFGVDELSAWFLVIVLGVGAATAIYGVPYLGATHPGAGGRGRRGAAHLTVAVLIAALAGVVTARTIVAFLASWEVMAIAAWLLIVFEQDQREARRAGLVYIVLTHASMLALLGMFAAWAGGAAGLTFADLGAAAARGMPHETLVLVLALVGFGIKAGVVPAHFWLPGAHAAAPSHVSALLSGVMIKTGIYGLFRVLALLGAVPAWWGWTLLLLGLASALLGVLWALAQHDLKRLLAYHSVENIGIILLGLGVGALGTAWHQPALALVGLTGALLHTLNHALFKGLLFLGAGAVVRATGTRDIDRLGGLARALPRTTLAFLVGSLAIAGLPPLNGFVSEWIIFRGMLSTGAMPIGLRAVSAMSAGLALTAALALACFAKLFGTVFLGRPRDPAAAAPREAGGDAGLVGPQAALAAACVAIGVAPALVVPACARAAGMVLGDPSGTGLPGLAASLSGVSVMAVILVALAGAIWLVRHATRALRAVAVDATWACAFPSPGARVQYTASSFAAPLLAPFGPLAGTRIEQGPVTFAAHAVDPVLDKAGEPLWGLLKEAALRLRLLQTGRIRWYLLYVIFSLLGLLLYLWARTAQ